MRRTLTWLVTLPFAAASVVLGHAIAYDVTGTPTGGMHDYLAHAPQVVCILASLAVLGLAADSRARRHSPVPLAVLGIGAFVAQEHLERLIHTGHVPFLFASPVMWLGIALQLHQMRGDIADHTFDGAVLGVNDDALRLRNGGIDAAEFAHINESVLVDPVHRHGNFVRMRGEHDAGRTAFVEDSDAVAVMIRIGFISKRLHIIEPDPLPTPFVSGRTRRIDQGA